MSYKSTNPYTKGTRMWYLYRWVKRNTYSIILLVLITIIIVGVHSLLAPKPHVLELDNGIYMTATIVEPTIPDHSITLPPIPIKVYAAPPVELVYTSPYTEADVIILASILEAECWEGDRRKEATVVVNLLEHKPIGFYNPDGTIQGVIEARKGRAFNGSLTDKYKDRLYSEVSYQAAYEVLIEGYRAWDGDPDMIYFSNISTATDTSFIDSINWIEEQPNNRSHSFGKDY